MKKKKFLLKFVLLIYLYMSGCLSLSIDQSIEVNRDADWLMIGGNPEKTNTSFSDFSLNPPFDLLWKYDVDGGLSRNCLSVSDAILFVNTLNAECYAIDIQSGKSLGRTSTSGQSSFSTPLIFNNDIIITSAGDRVSIKSFNLIRGETKWERNISWIESSPVLVNEDIIISTVRGELYMLNARDGKILWKSGINKRLSSFYTSPTVCGDKIFLGSNDGYMYAFGLNHGKELWKYKTGASIFCDASVKNGRVYFGSDDMNYYCLDTLGNLIWKKNLQTKFLSSPAFYKDRLILSCVNGNLYSLDTSDANINWTFKSKGIFSASPLLHNDNIFIGSYDQNFYCIKADNGNELWRYECEGRVKTSAVIWKKFIFVASDDKYVYCFN